MESTFKHTWRTTRIWSELLRHVLTSGKLVLNAITSDSFRGPSMTH